MTDALGKQFDEVEEMIPHGQRHGTPLPVSHYKKHYNRGWTSSRNPRGGDKLDRADARGEPEAWYDGYMDYAVGRPKWDYLKARRQGVPVDQLHEHEENQ